VIKTGLDEEAALWNTGDGVDIIDDEDDEAFSSANSINSSMSRSDSPVDTLMENESNGIKLLDAELLLIEPDRSAVASFQPLVDTVGKL
jgi:hypothetical protein